MFKLLKNVIGFISSLGILLTKRFYFPCLILISTVRLAICLLINLSSVSRLLSFPSISSCLIELGGGWFLEWGTIQNVTVQIALWTGLRDCLMFCGVFRCIHRTPADFVRCYSLKDVGSDWLLCLVLSVVRTGLQLIVSGLFRCRNRLMKRFYPLFLEHQLIHVRGVICSKNLTLIVEVCDVPDSMNRAPTD